jgi:hypothetical protein
MRAVLFYQGSSATTTTNIIIQKKCFFKRTIKILKLTFPGRSKRHRYGPYFCARYYGGNTVRKVTVYGPYRLNWVVVSAVLFFVATPVFEVVGFRLATVV